MTEDTQALDTQVVDQEDVNSQIPEIPEIPEMTRYENDVLPDLVTVRIQGLDIKADPMKFTAGMEVKIREAMMSEWDMLDATTPATLNSTLIESRKMMLNLGKVYIPKVCPEMTPEDVEEKLSFDAIGALLGFFLRTDWREQDVQVMTNRPAPRLSQIISTTQTTQETQGLKKLKSSNKS